MEKLILKLLTIAIAIFLGAGTFQQTWYTVFCEIACGYLIGDILYWFGGVLR